MLHFIHKNNHLKVKVKYAFWRIIFSLESLSDQKMQNDFFD